jgi:aryl-alcohol dehydrogenase-like predicted oxidoreductase
MRKTCVLAHRERSFEMSPVTNIADTVTIGGDLTVARIGYGAMQLTGPKVWGEYPDHDKGVALLREAVAVGVTYIDTADVYGPHSNEELIREALHPYPDNLVIATKGGFVRSGPEYTDMGAVGNRHYVRQAAGIVFSPWHPGAVPRGDEGRPFHAVIDPIAERHDATAQQIALAWQLHRTAQALPIPGTTSSQHLRENLAAAHLSLTQDEVDAITALAAEENHRS